MSTPPAPPLPDNLLKHGHILGKYMVEAALDTKLFFFVCVYVNVSGFGEPFRIVILVPSQIGSGALCTCSPVATPGLF